ncbi:S8 family serine peptidase [Streptomyces sp. YC504]|uniref:S8 family serine peptidase n=1 Tax=Streptomyces mesophilus TaxID=1775132 RepID=A0A6G4XSJ8_9ACTN|nr:S8 family serine peptidase [Streptomyces mesophilus]NGO80182.1 S8 family serine peptidase [Streptomyces mesophilus]
MHTSISRRVPRWLCATAVVAGLLSVPPATADGGGPTAKGGSYLVELEAAPAATHPDTRPAAGEKLATGSAEVKEYRAELADQQRKVAERHGVEIRTRYTAALDGFAAKLSADQVADLRGDPSVKRLLPLGKQKLDEVTPADTLDLTGRDGLWNRLGGTQEYGSSGQIEGAGEGVVIGVIDSGIWPESKSFAAPQLTKPLKNWHGTCEVTEDWPAGLCNSKLIGARAFSEAMRAGNGGQLPEGAYPSARDDDSHGTHTASTAAGNHGPRMVIEGKDYGTASGIAPAARIASYKAFFNGSGWDEDIIAAIDRAVLDGVDVLNYSAGQAFGETTTTSPIGEAFRNAAKAGVFVAASAGNNPYPRMVSNPWPWVTTVAASTYAPHKVTVRLGNGTSRSATSWDRRTLPSAPLVHASLAGRAGQDADAVAKCQPGSLDPEKIRGKIVYCQYSSLAPSELGKELTSKGAVGLIQWHGLFRATSTIYGLPSAFFHDGVVAGPVEQYLKTAGADATAAITEGDPDTTNYPGLSDFSSKGPGRASGTQLKPDVAAPGTDVLAAVPPAKNGRTYDVKSGTSMAAPHIAGLAALVKQVHPDWTPMEIKSALMTTAAELVDTTDPLEQGAGLARPAKALDPGLVLDSTDSAWAKWSADPESYHVNSPSIHDKNLIGTETTTRTVRNVSNFPETYEVSAAAGQLAVEVSPRRFTVLPGQSKSVSVTMSHGKAAYEQFSTGFLTLKGSRHTVRMPIAVKPMGLTVAPKATVAAADGKVDLKASVGFADFSAKLSGLTAADQQSGRVTGAPGQPFDPTSPLAQKVTFTVKEGARLAVLKFASDEFKAGAGQQVSVFIKDETGKSVGNLAIPNHATGSTWTLADPRPGTYTAYVWAYKTGTAADIDYRLTTAVVPDGSGIGSLKVTPDPIVPGKDVTVTVSWPQLEAGRSYFGHIAYSDAHGELKSTVLSVTP